MIGIDDSLQDLDGAQSLIVVQLMVKIAARFGRSEALIPKLGQYIVLHWESASGGESVRTE